MKIPLMPWRALQPPKAERFPRVRCPFFIDAGGTLAERVAERGARGSNRGWSLSHFPPGWVRNRTARLKIPGKAKKLKLRFGRGLAEGEAGGRSRGSDDRAVLPSHSMPACAMEVLLFPGGGGEREREREREKDIERQRERVLLLPGVHTRRIQHPLENAGSCTREAGVVSFIRLGTWLHAFRVATRPTPYKTPIIDI